MANPTRTILRAYIRSLVSDADSANYGVSDSDMNVLLNEKQHVYGALYPEENVTRATSVTLAQGDKSAGISLGDTARAIVSINRGATTGPLLERKSVADIVRMQNEDSTQGVVSAFAAERNSGSATGWILYPHPIPAASTDLYVNWLPDIQDFGNDSAVSPFGAHAGYTIARMVAVDCAMILGRADRVSQIEKMLPERIQAYMKFSIINGRGRPDREEVT